MSKTKQNKTKKEEEDKKNERNQSCYYDNARHMERMVTPRFQNIDFSIHKIKAGAVGWENVTETQAE